MPRNTIRRCHILGTARLGDDPKSRSSNPDHQTHDVKIVPGRWQQLGQFRTAAQPTMTIMGHGLGFRAADRIISIAKRGELSA